MVANPDLCDDESLLDMIANRNPALTYLMFTQIEAAATNITPRTLMEGQLTSALKDRQEAVNCLVRYYMADTSSSAPDSIISLLDGSGEVNDELGILHSQMVKADSTAFKAQYDTVDVITLDSVLNISKDEYIDLLDIMAENSFAGETIYALSTVEVPEVVQTATAGQYEAASLARILVNLNADTLNYQEPTYLPVNTAPPRLRPFGNWAEPQPEPGFSLQPNPARDHVTIQYRLPDHVNEAVLRIIDIMGQEVMRLELSGQIGSRIVNLSSLPPAWYAVTIESPNGEYFTKPLILNK
jgi:hypothetical protein